MAARGVRAVSLPFDQQGFYKRFSCGTFLFSLKKKKIMSFV
jgi:hypothetical protein